MAYEMRISDWSSDVGSSDLIADAMLAGLTAADRAAFAPLLAHMLKEFLTARAYRPFGLCAECRHFRRDAAPGTPHFCGLLGVPLDGADAAAICVEDRKSTRLNSSH